jgi:hypothetical protein
MHKSTIPEFDRLQTVHALDSAATVIGYAAATTATILKRKILHGVSSYRSNVGVIRTLYESKIALDRFFSYTTRRFKTSHVQIYSGVKTFIFWRRFSRTKAIKEIRVQCRLICSEGHITSWFFIPHKPAWLYSRGSTWTSLYNADLSVPAVFILWACQETTKGRPTAVRRVSSEISFASRL